MKGLQRVVGAIIITTTMSAAALLAWSVSGSARTYTDTTESVVSVGVWHVIYDSQAPPLLVLAAALLLALLFAAGVAIVEYRVTTRDRRSADRTARPLAPRVVMAETRGVWAGEVTVTVVVPAHNEEDRLAATLTSLGRQSRRPDRVVVVADNCTDDTAAIALAAGAEVFETVGNDRKKAGALNQVLRDVLPGQGDNDLVMVMDADTVLHERFLQVVVRRMSEDRALMAIGGLFTGENGYGLIGQLQRNEYARYAREVRRRRGRVYVLTGTATVFRPRALRSVAEERGVSLPGVSGDVYDTLALTEDNEITLAVKSLGALIMSPAECTVVTEIMPTWKALWRQRLRWQRGALENLASYGLRPQTLRYWAQQLGICYGVLALAAYLGLMVLLTVSFDHFVWFPFWLGIGLVFAVERVITVRGSGWRAGVLAALIVPELLYSFFLGVVFLKGVLDMTIGRTAVWTHADLDASVVGVVA